MTEIPQAIADKLAALEREFHTNEENNNADRNIITDYERTIAARDRRQEEILAEIRAIKTANHIWMESIKRGDHNYLQIPVSSVADLPPTNAQRVIALFQETRCQMTVPEIHAVIGDGRKLNNTQVLMSNMKKNGEVWHDEITHRFWPKKWGTQGIAPHPDINSETNSTQTEPP